MNLTKQLHESERKTSCIDLCKEALEIVNDFYNKEDDRIAKDLKGRAWEIQVLHRQLILLNIKLTQLDKNLGVEIRFYMGKIWQIKNVWYNK